MNSEQTVILILVLAFSIVVLIAMATSVRVVPAQRAGIVERFGRYKRTLDPGPAVIIPFIDRIDEVDLREQMVSFPPQPVITEDSVVVEVETVIHYQIVDPKAATYEIFDVNSGLETIAVATLREVVGGMDLDNALTSREEVNSALRDAMDEATGAWGIRMNRVEVTAIDAPSMSASVRRLESPDVDLETFAPPDPWNVGIVVRVVAGPVDGLGEECFDVMVCTPRWLERRVRDEGPLVGRHHLIVERYDVAQIRQCLTTAVESEDGRTWQELVGRLGQLGKRELADQQS